MHKKLILVLLVFLLIVPTMSYAQETPPEVREAAISALNTAIPNIGRPTSWRHVLLGNMSDSTLGCTLAIGTALASPVTAYQVFLNYNGTEYMYHVSGDGRIVVPCDPKIPGMGSGPGGALTTPVATTVPGTTPVATSNAACSLTVNLSNIRASASTSAAIVRTTNANEVLAAIGRTADNSWYQVAEGWVAGSVVVPSGNCGALAVTGNASVDYGACPADFTGYQPPRLFIGGQGQVESASGVPNRVRGLPSTSSPVLFEMTPGTTFQVIGGPQCGNSIVWWEVNANGRTGWTAESDFRAREYFVVAVGGVGGNTPAGATGKPFTAANVTTVTALSTRFPTPVYRFAWSPNNTQFAVATETGVQLFSYPDMQPLPNFNSKLAIPRSTEEVSALAFDPGSRYLVIGYLSGAIRMMELNTGEVGLIRNSHTHPITAIDFTISSGTPSMATVSGRLAVTGNAPRPAEGTLKVWNLVELDLVTGEMPILYETTLTEPLFDVAFTWLQGETQTGVAFTTATALKLHDYIAKQEVYSYTLAKPTPASQLQATFLTGPVAAGQNNAALLFTEGNQLMQVGITERQPRPVVTLSGGTIGKFSATNAVDAPLVAIANVAEPVEAMGVSFYAPNAISSAFAFPVPSSDLMFNTANTTLATIGLDGTLMFWIVP